MEIDQANDEKYIYVTFLQFNQHLEALWSPVMALDAGEFSRRGKLIYLLRSEFLVESDQMNDEKYIYGTFLWFDQHLKALWSPVVALDVGEFPRQGELIYMLRSVFLMESDQTNDEKYIPGTSLQFYQYLEALWSSVVVL